MIVLIFGRGFLGERLARELDGAILSRVDIADAAAVREELVRSGAKVVINAAGKTGRPNVDWCETHRAETYRSNVTGALTLAEVCDRENAYLLHLGSGCIFYGGAPSGSAWREDDFANPVAFYSRTKYAADLVLSQLPNVAIARLRMPIDDCPHPRNLITKLAGYREVNDVQNSVTIVSDLIDVVKQLVQKRGTGVFHVTNPGVMRTRELMALYRQVVDSSHDCQFITAEELVSKGLAAKARSNCVLASARLDELGIRMRPLEIALPETMKRYAQNLRAGHGVAPPLRSS